MPPKLTTELFIARAIKVHGNTYDYSKTIYTLSNKKLTINCYKHGTFSTLPHNHLKGRGCPKCKVTKLKDAFSHTTKNFIEDAIRVHNSLYDYSNVNYVNSHTKVRIVCKTHGEFAQTPTKHLNGQGCPKCIGKSLNDFERIEEFNKIHNNKYSYDKMEYTSSANKILIICPIHGEFSQTPSNHKQGHGCPKCCDSLGEREIRHILDSIGIAYVQEHTFDKCKNINPLPFDFYLPKPNICIEYDGELHYKTWSNRTTDSAINKLKSIQTNDRIKNDYCNKNGIRLIRIPFWSFCDIKEILLREIGIV